MAAAIVAGASSGVARTVSTNQAAGWSVTDAEGSFRAEALAVGTYEVRVDQAGFAPFRDAEIELSLGQTMQLVIVLVPASYPGLRERAD